MYRAIKSPNRSNNDYDGVGRPCKARFEHSLRACACEKRRGRIKQMCTHLYDNVFYNWSQLFAHKWRQLWTQWVLREWRAVPARRSGHSVPVSYWRLPRLNRGRTTDVRWLNRPQDPVAGTVPTRCWWCTDDPVVTRPLKITPGVNIKSEYASAENSDPVFKRGNAYEFNIIEYVQNAIVNE